MALTDAKTPCPVCGDLIPMNVARCPICGATLAENLTQVRQTGTIPLDRLLPKEKLAWVQPVIVHPWAMLSIVLGVLGLICPFIGMTPGFLAVGAGWLAIQSIRKKPRTGGIGRALLGMALGFAAILLWGGAIAYLVLKSR